MKYIILFSYLLFSGQLKAQQAKAYEVIYYSVKYQNKTFSLYHADGYLAASQIRIKQKKKVTQIFRPISGTVEDNGDFAFDHNEAQIVLHQINETCPTPLAIKATYIVKERKISLYFKQIKGKFN